MITTFLTTILLISTVALPQKPVSQVAYGKILPDYNYVAKKTNTQILPDFISSNSAKPKAVIVTKPVEAIPTVVVAAPTAVPSPVAINNASAPKVLTEEQITYLGSCEAGMDPAKNTGNGYYGAFQFSYGTWKSMGTGYERADLAPIDVQKDAVQRLVGRSSIFTQFPACSRKMRLIGMI